MADVRGASGAPAVAAFGGQSAPTPSSPLYVDLSNGDLYVLINNVATKVGAALPLSVANGGTGVSTTQANKVFAGPASGADAAPSFRQIAANELSNGVTGSGAVVLALNPALTGYLDFPAIANPAAPAAGNVRFHALTTQGFTRFEQDNEAPTNLTVCRDNVFIAKNTTASPMTAGVPVYVTGSTGNVPNIGLAKADSLTTLPCVGITVDAIGANNFGQVMRLGVIQSINTSAFGTGDTLYVSAATAGVLTKTRPAAPNYVDVVANVLVSGVGNGSILVAIAPYIGNIDAGLWAA